MLLTNDVAPVPSGLRGVLRPRRARGDALRQPADGRDRGVGARGERVRHLEEVRVKALSLGAQQPRGVE